MSHDDYVFHWRAKFSDGTLLKQFDDDGTEHGFKEIQDKEELLEYFYLELIPGDDQLIVGVDLKTGAFNINDFVLNALKDDLSWDEFNPEFRLINFRRVRKQFTLGGGFEPGADIDYFFGWQVTHEGTNYKKLMKIGADGTFSIS